MVDRGHATPTASTVNMTAALERLYRHVLGLNGDLQLHEPWFRGNEWTYVKECIDTGWVSSAGTFVERFEDELKRRTGAEVAVATANGTVALHAALHALGVGRNDLVICPAISFVATANSIAHCGADPLFVDVDETTMCLDPARLEELLSVECEGSGVDLRHRESGRRIGAVMVVHLFGHPADMSRIPAICEAHGVPLVEDAAEAIGSLYHGRACGTFGRAGVLSFNGNKTLTTGGGGAILTNDPAFGERLKHLTTTARIKHDWEFDHDEVGFNYRMPNINAALGCAQLEQLDDFLVRKRRLAETIARTLTRGDGGTLLWEPAGARSNFWLNTVLLDDASQRDTVLSETNRLGIHTRPCWRMLADLPMFRAAPIAKAGVAVARDRAARLINIPSSAQLAGND